MINIRSLLTVSTIETIANVGLAVAKALGLPTTSWRTGDPTKSLYQYVAEMISNWEATAVEIMSMGFLSTASDEGARLIATEVYGVPVPEATYATPSVTIENQGGGYYELDASDFVVKSSVSQKTYHNTNTVKIVLGPGVTAEVPLEADEAGSDSSVAANEIDEIVTTRDGVVILSSSAATATDAPSKDWIVEQCNASLGALSPDGPPDAYEYVAKNAALTGTTECAKAQSTLDSDEGEVTVYVAGASGPVSAPALALIQTAILRYANPMCSTATVTHATPIEEDVALTIIGTDLPVNASAVAAASVAATFAAAGIAESVSHSAITAPIQTTLVAAGATNVSVRVTSPVADITRADGEYTIVGDVTVS